MKTLGIIGSVFLSVGMLFLVLAGFALGSDRDAAADALPADGTVIALERRLQDDGGVTYAPIVEWVDDSGDRHRLVSSTGSYPSTYALGDGVSVLYDPDRPGRAVIDSFGQRFTGILIFGGIGLVFALIGAPMVYFYAIRQWTIRWLKRHGTRIEATFVRSELDRSTAVKGRNPYRVFAQGTHPQTGKLASFVSEPIWLDLTSELKNAAIPVLINRTKHGPHFVDLSHWVHESERD